ncbi:MAG TPA: Mur ligase domain-containing protein, partial [Bacteroidales bacterium]|nr:Mur ligase domain-containing protein [Bacteroidales bacterium]
MQIQTVKLIESIQYLSVVGNLPATISGIETDSRKISQGFVFVAIQGVAVDGHIFIEKAIEQGASVIVCQHVPQKIIDSVAYVVVENSAVACGYILRAYY